MTEIAYEYTAKDGSKKVTKLYPEVQRWMENGGKYKVVEKYVETNSEGYCMEGAAKASARWKNYKF